jgi:hypothetical protein
MLRGPKGEKRPTDVIGAAVMSYLASANCAYPRKKAAEQTPRLS